MPGEQYTELVDTARRDVIHQDALTFLLYIVAPQQLVNGDDG